MTTYIFAYGLDTNKGMLTGRIEAASSKEAQDFLVKQFDAKIITGNVRRIKNQKLAREMPFFDMQKMNAH